LNLPRYAESGGQLTDKGLIKTNEGEFIVDEAFRVGETIVHKGRVSKGVIKKGTAYPAVDEKRRKALRRAHTATHLLQAALRKVLGEHVTQQGSLVDEDRLRFDFTHFEALTREELDKVEQLANEYILEAVAVNKCNVSFDEAKKEGALAFFKDKYKDMVRVVSVGDYSKELCGGTHVDNTSEIGLFKIVSESSISSGVRRIEAVVGANAFNEIKEHEKLSQKSAEILRCDLTTLPKAIENLQRELKKERDEKKKLNEQLLKYSYADSDKKIIMIDKIPVFIENIPGKSMQDLLLVCDELKKRQKTLFIFLTSLGNVGGSFFVCNATEDLVKEGITAEDFVKTVGGNLTLLGGGRVDRWQGKISDDNSASLGNIKKCFEEYIKIKRHKK